MHAFSQGAVLRGSRFGAAALAAWLLVAAAPDAFAQGTVKSVHGDWQIR
jgi:hypothetical protein